MYINHNFPIRYWNEFYGRFDTYDFGFGQEAFQEKGCAFTNCYTTKDRNLLPIQEYDAIIIHIRGLPNDWPKIRSISQVHYILLFLCYSLCNIFNSLNSIIIKTNDTYTTL